MNDKLMKHIYPYAWLDEVVEITLNPEKTNVSDIAVQQLQVIEDKFDKELQAVLKNLKANTFYLFSSKKIRATVIHYHDSLLLLEKQAMMNLAGYPNDHPLAATGENIIFHIQSMSAAFNKRYGKYITASTAERNPAMQHSTVISKLLCKLSVDQIGIILKAADDTKIIVASSLSVIFRYIVPYLSTDHTKNISWTSMRKSTYRMEETDKEIAIATLEKLILKIKNY
ncbi:MAG TPA: hypothetical protein VGM63_07520 [Mucilaginibacter sp.]|jgi:hypothetical protein